MEQLPEYENKKVISFCARTGEGLEQFEEYIHTLFLSDKIRYNDEIYITNARQKALLIEALESIRQLWNSVEAGMPEDLYSIDLMNAYETLGKMIGETVEDDIVDKIFKDFCMGK